MVILEVTVFASVYSPAYVCISLDNISYFTFAGGHGMRGGQRGVVVGGLGGKERSRELLGSHGVIAQMGIPALAPQA